MHTSVLTKTGAAPSFPFALEKSYGRRSFVAVPGVSGGIIPQQLLQYQAKGLVRTGFVFNHPRYGGLSVYVPKGFLSGITAIKSGIPISMLITTRYSLGGDTVFHLSLPDFPSFKISHANVWGPSNLEPGDLVSTVFAFRNKGAFSLERILFEVINTTEGVVCKIKRPDLNCSTTTETCANSTIFVFTNRHGQQTPIHVPTFLLDNAPHDTLAVEAIGWLKGSQAGFGCPAGKKQGLDALIKAISDPQNRFSATIISEKIEVASQISQTEGARYVHFPTLLGTSSTRERRRTWNNEVITRKYLPIEFTIDGYSFRFVGRLYFDGPAPSKKDLQVRMVIPGNANLIELLLTGQIGFKES